MHPPDVLQRRVDNLYGLAEVLSARLLAHGAPSGPGTRVRKDDFTRWRWTSGGA